MKGGIPDLGVEVEAEEVGGDTCWRQELARAGVQYRISALLVLMREPLSYCGDPDVVVCDSVGCRLKRPLKKGELGSQLRYTYLHLSQRFWAQFERKVHVAEKSLKARRF